MEDGLLSIPRPSFDLQKVSSQWTGGSARRAAQRRTYLSFGARCVLSGQQHLFFWINVTASTEKVAASRTQRKQTSRLRQHLKAALDPDTQWSV
ncbi:hypothetical protein F2P81_020106 [Scophthalmus maximus]|uniref:Uncharacterized protein n=1 Tax=Scophthalmus maximus TaxID=52904 RepID=A0A6A4S535_SCOMX|nr:hypothetical protein F2P81_020106 [Scophthalmus maximus]